MTRKRSATDLMTAKILQEEISSIADEKEPRGSAAGTLAGEPVLNVGTLVPFPTDRPRPAPRVSGAAEARSMPLALVEAIESLEAPNSGADAHAVEALLLATFAVLIYRYSGVEDMILGIFVPRARGLEESGSEAESSSGALPLQITLANDLTFKQVWEQVRRGYREISDNPGGAPGATSPRRHPEDRRINDFRFQFEVEISSAAIIEDEDTPGSGDSVNAPDISRSGNELYLRGARRHQGLDCILVYNAELFDAVTVRRMLAHCDTLLRSAVANPEEQIRALTVITEAERRTLIEDWSKPAANTRSPAPPPAFIHETIANQASQTPDAVAILFEGRAITYRELDERSNQLAHTLRGRGAGPEVLVGISLQRSPELVIGLLGILKAGAAFVPLEPSYPADRLSSLLSETRPALLVTDSILLAKCRCDGTTTFCIDTEWDALAQESSAAPRVRLTEGNLATVMFSSGSTGEPKAIPRSHRSLGGGTRTRSTYQLSESDRHVFKTSLDSTLLGREIFWPLSTGGCMIIAGRHENNDTALLLRLIVDHKISILTLVPSLLRLLVAEDGFESCTSLRFVHCFGEALAPDVEDTFCRKVASRLSTAYGTTEVPALALRKCNGPGVRPLGDLGYRLGDAEIYILDERLQPVPIGVPGELFAGGPSIASGYLNRRQQTEERFIPHPFRVDAGARLYRTGDRLRWRSDGSLEFLGRLDDQVKIRGYRVEPAEVELALSSHKALHESAVVARPNSWGENQLVAFLVLKAGEPTLGELRAHLSKQLPTHMVPSRFARLTKLPRRPNGKIDREALRVVELDLLKTTEPCIAPRTPLEQRITEIWRGVLGVERVGINDDFFDLGGDSLQAIRFLSAVEQELHRGLSLASVFRHPTVAAFVEHLGASTEELTRPVVEKLNHGTGALGDRDVAIRLRGVQ